MSNESVFVMNLILPQKIWNAVRWYSQKTGDEPNDIIIESIKAQFDSDICNNFERIGIKYTEELEKILGWKESVTEEIKDFIEKEVPAQI